MVHISYHITTTKYIFFKITNIINMISILNFIFTIVLYVTR
jgi:hypothetical protein